ncbi:hypothetical protein NHH03_03495 [Stieleria sp. TO1_6]|uniref:hypothetical protein n=1 Tax=Stieleria tagensis TaxID=2956795 RepID=UPI00209AAF84|nr:hypothetical protein [Stieleria tagensis]MCO8120789.1 hypothetical protein [Stieleria tagensis]
MKTDKYLLDDIARTQLDTTRRRRENRSRRYYQMLLAALGMVGLLILAAPSLVSRSGIAKSLLASTAQRYGWTASAGSIDVGWITPLSINQLELVGQSGETRIQIDRTGTALTVMNLLRFDPAKIGEVSLRGVDFSCRVSPGHSSVESDLAELLTPNDSTDSSLRAIIQVQDAGATVTDSVTDQSWTLNQSNLNINLDGTQISGDVAGVVNAPGGSDGAIQSKFVWQPNSQSTKPDSETITTVSAGKPGDDGSRLWELTVDTESFPLSVMNLVSRRFAGAVNAMPDGFSGDTTGHLQLSGALDGSVKAELGNLRIRNLQTVHDPQPDAPAKQWGNQLATLDGRFAISDGWLFGYGLEVTTDFASATLDGSFPTTISLTGSHDNPISWLQALDGQARLDVDLAALDRAMPGLLPLRSETTLVSGRAHGIIENSNRTGSNASRRSRLKFSSDAIRARADGRMVAIEPIELTATVADDQGTLRAERFDLSSSFAKASGSGSLQDGTADLQIDFGRLYSMLRPVINLSESSLGGTAGGQVKWSVSQDAKSSIDIWGLSGQGEAKNLMVTLPGGHRFKRAIVQGELSAKGRWNGKALQQLSAAEVVMHSSGVSASAQLTAPVNNPTADSMYPIHLTTDGRLENLSESLRPWLPEFFHDAEGRVTGTAIATLSRSQGTLTSADFDLSQPRFAYRGNWYSQPTLKVRFEGVLDWPSGNFSTQQCTVAGQAISLAVQGEVSPEKTQLDVAWEADLERLQKSMGATVARARTVAAIRPVGYRAVQQEPYRVGGHCKGKATITRKADHWRIDSSAAATNLALYPPTHHYPVPPGTSVTAFGPQDQPTFSQSMRRSGNLSQTDPIWMEPQLQIEGPIEYETDSGMITLQGLAFSNDALSGTLSGLIQSSPQNVRADLKGTATWQMNRVAERLSTLIGTPIYATGIHETPIELTIVSPADRPMTITATGELGWDQCDVAGIRMGKCVLPCRITENQIKIAKTTIPLISISAAQSATGQSATGPSSEVSPEAGQARFAAEINYASGPMTIRLDQGAKIESLRITPAAATTWLQYLAPLAAGSTQIDGIVSAEFADALIVIDNPSTSTIRGSLDVQEMHLSSGPLARQLIQGVDQIKSLARLTGAEVAPAEQQTWIEMPAQSVEFAFENAVVSHQRMYFQIDRAEVMTSGRVGLDSQIQLVAQVPLDARWLGSDLKSLAGQTLTFPITGTLTRPTLDSSALRNMVTQLGTQATAEVVQDRLDGLIQKQLGSGMEQLNSGLEKFLGF